MPRTFHWTWLGALALALSPAVALGQGAAAQTHTVREGDTLWDLARQYRGDPFLWPDIYRVNTSVVEDPHWIYPGEVLNLSAGDNVAAVPATDTPAPPATVESSDTLGRSADVPADLAAAPAAPAAPLADAADTVALPADAPLADEPLDDEQQASLAELTAAGAHEDYVPLFGPKPGQTTKETLRAYIEQPYRPLRKSEFYSSGFLTENEKLPFGKVLGSVTPPQIKAEPRNVNALPYTTVAIEAPRGATYQIGDTLLVVRLGADLGSFGDMVIPTGLAQVIDTADGSYLASIIALYGTIRSGQRVLPAEKFAGAGNAHAVPVGQGVTASLLGGLGRQELKAPQMVVFLSKGRQDGVAPGDLFEIRREPKRFDDGTMRVDEVMGTLQVVHAREHSATARVLNVVSPDIPPGTTVRQVAKLPS